MANRAHYILGTLSNTTLGETPLTHNIYSPTVQDEPVSLTQQILSLTDSIKNYKNKLQVKMIKQLRHSESFKMGKLCMIYMNTCILTMDKT